MSREEGAPTRPRRERRPIISNFNGFKVEILEFEEKLDPDEFLRGYTQLNEFLSMRRSQMTRKLNWFLLDRKSMLHYGGLTCVQNELETIKI